MIKCEKCFYEPLEVVGEVNCPEGCGGCVQNLQCPYCNSLYVVPVVDCEHWDEFYSLVESILFLDVENGSSAVPGKIGL